MRLLYTVLCITTCLCLCAFDEQARGQDYYGDVVYYYSYYPEPYPAPQVVYYPSYEPAYYAQPTYYAAYASPEYYSYHSPCVTYAEPVCCEPTNSESQAVDARYPPERSAPTQSAPTRPAPTQPTTTVTVGAYDNRFDPQTINVQSGTTVRWVNYGQHNHTITDSDDRWDSGDIKPGGTYSATFKEPGTYYYYCRHHTNEKMQGTIVVGTGAGAGAENEYRAAMQLGY